MSDQIQDLIAKKNFPKAVEALRAQAQAKPHDRRLRLQLADVYVMAGRDRDAIPVLMTLADQEASDGFVAKAVAILKRIEKIEPGRRDVEDRLAKLIQDKSRRTGSFPRPALPKAAAAASGMNFGFEEIDSSSSEIQLGVSTPEAPAPSLPEPTPEPSFDPMAAIGAFTPEADLPPPSMEAPPADGLVADSTTRLRSSLNSRSRRNPRASPPCCSTASLKQNCWPSCGALNWSPSRLAT